MSDRTSTNTADARPVLVRFTTDDGVQLRHLIDEETLAQIMALVADNDEPDGDSHG